MSLWAGRGPSEIVTYDMNFHQQSKYRLPSYRHGKNQLNLLLISNFAYNLRLNSPNPLDVIPLLALGFTTQ